MRLTLFAGLALFTLLAASLLGCVGPRKTAEEHRIELKWCRNDGRYWFRALKRCQVEKEDTR